MSIGSGRVIPLWEIVAGFARSGGPGGQHVNKVETKVELRWAPAHTSLQLSEAERARMMAALRPRLTSEGWLIVTASEERSQFRNREIALEKLAAIVRAALEPPRPRVKTRPSRAAKARRMDAKRRLSSKKRNRRSRED